MTHSFLIRASLPLLGIWLSTSSPVFAQGVERMVQARTVLHNDNTKTESMKDRLKRQASDTTYDTAGVVIAKKTFLLNEKGEPVQGLVRDGAGNLIARVQFYFDNLGRLIEERCTNSQGEIFRRVIRQYDINGQPLPPQAFDYEVKLPTMKAATINFTTQGINQPLAEGDRVISSTGMTAQDGRPQVMSVSPRTGNVTAVQPTAPAAQGQQRRSQAQPAATTQKPKKKGFLNFGKK